MLCRFFSFLSSVPFFGHTDANLTENIYFLHQFSFICFFNKHLSITYCSLGVECKRLENFFLCVLMLLGHFYFLSLELRVL